MRCSNTNNVYIYTFIFIKNKTKQQSTPHPPPPPKEKRKRKNPSSYEKHKTTNKPACFLHVTVWTLLLCTENNVLLIKMIKSW